MDFRFDKDERDIIDQVGLTLRRHLRPARLLDDASVDGAWRALAEDGWIHAGLAAEFGGAELPLAMVAAIGRESGRVVAGDAYTNNAVLLPALFAGAGPEALADFAPGFLLGDGRGLAPQGGDGEQSSWCFGAEPGFAAYEIDGGRLVRYPAGSWELRGPAGLGLAIGAVTLRADAEPDLTVDATPFDPGTLAAANVVHAAGLVGLGETALADTVEYVGQREQFGGPIGRFQAIKHGLAEVAVWLEVAWNAVLYAALQPSDVAVSIAHLQAVEACDAATRAMVQFFGGIAMTWEHHAHLYVKTAQLSRFRFGSTREHALRVVGELSTEAVVL